MSAPIVRDLSISPDIIRWGVASPMPIPPFDAIMNCLPPHLGDPAGNISDLSPYYCSMDELCGQFATSPARRTILDGFLRLRAECYSRGISGFQWLAGSFLEDIETHESRDPRDIDVVTFVQNPPTPTDLDVVVTAPTNLLNRAHVKASYSVDHFWVSLGGPPADIVSVTRYWYGLFSHRRDRTWKGMLVVALADKSDDDAAKARLAAAP